MDVEAVRTELTRALDATAPVDRTGSRFRAAREVLIARGAEALDITPPGTVSLDEILRIAVDAPPAAGRREFAELLVHASGIKGLVPVETESRIQSFLERALLNPLRRAGYPFDGTKYEKRQALAVLHVTIEEHLRPLEPTMPLWLQGNEGTGKD